MLAEYGLVERNRDSMTYRLGWQIFALARARGRAADPPGGRAATLKALVASLEERVHLSVLQGAEVLTLMSEVAEPHAPGRRLGRPGDARRGRERPASPAPAPLQRVVREVARLDVPVGRAADLDRDVAHLGCSGVAPCQCHEPFGIVIQSPTTILRGGRPRSRRCPRPRRRAAPGRSCGRAAWSASARSNQTAQTMLPPSAAARGRRARARGRCPRTSSPGRRPVAADAADDRRVGHARGVYVGCHVAKCCWHVLSLRDRDGAHESIRPGSTTPGTPTSSRRSRSRPATPSTTN